MADAVDLLQAQTDVNSAEQQLSLQNLVIEQNKADLLQLIGAKKFFLMEVTDTILVDSSLELASLLNFLERNPQLLSAEQQILIDKQLVKEISAQRYPSVKLNAGYDFFQSDWNKDDLRMNRIYGPVAGITIQVPVFNGFIYKTQKDIAKIRVDNSIIQQESLISSLTTQTTQLYRSYSTTLNQIVSQQQNFEMTRKLVEVVLEKFNHGQATILDVKAAQASFENAAFLLANLKYSAKVAEIELKHLTFSLVF
jgi:outer membrane protein TolC